MDGFGIGASVRRKEDRRFLTGKGTYTDDINRPRQLQAFLLRSPHAHARILSIDTSRALAVPGVKVVITAADIPDIPSEEAFVGEGPMNFRDLLHNCLARDKALYEGHVVAAVAGTSAAAVDAALALIEVQYEVLPFVIDVEAAMAPDAPVLHETMFTVGVTPISRIERLRAVDEIPSV